MRPSLAASPGPSSLLYRGVRLPWSTSIPGHTPLSGKLNFGSPSHLGSLLALISRTNRGFVLSGASTGIF